MMRNLTSIKKNKRPAHSLAYEPKGSFESIVSQQKPENKPTWIDLQVPAQRFNCIICDMKSMLLYIHTYIHNIYINIILWFWAMVSTCLKLDGSSKKVTSNQILLWSIRTEHACSRTTTTIITTTTTPL